MARHTVHLEWYQTIEDIEADTEEEAIQKAKQAIIDEHDRFVKSPAEDTIDWMDAYISTNHYATNDDWMED